MVYTMYRAVFSLVFVVTSVGATDNSELGLGSFFSSSSSMSSSSSFTSSNGGKPKVMFDQKVVTEENNGAGSHKENMHMYTTKDGLKVHTKEMETANGKAPKTKEVTRNLGQEGIDTLFGSSSGAVLPSRAKGRHHSSLGSLLPSLDDDDFFDGDGLMGSMFDDEQ